MKSDEIKGKIKTIEGTTKEAIGKIFGDKQLENEGKAQKAIGKLQSAVGKLEDDLDKSK